MRGWLGRMGGATGAGGEGGGVDGGMHGGCSGGGEGGGGEGAATVTSWKRGWSVSAAVALSESDNCKRKRLCVIRLMSVLDLSDSLEMR